MFRLFFLTVMTTVLNFAQCATTTPYDVGAGDTGSGPSRMFNPLSKIVFVYSNTPHPTEPTLTLKSSLEDALSLDGFDVRIINAKSILSGELYNGVMLAMPGGTASDFRGALGTDGAQNIQRFVKSGGGYLGICAGAYYAAETSEFTRGDETIKNGNQRYLFQGRAMGPKLKDYDPASARGALVAPIILTDPSDLVSPPLTSYWNGGSTFLPEIPDDVTVLARYDVGALDTDNVAVIHTKHDDGNVVLSGFHVEYQSKHLAEHYHADIRGFAPELVSDNAKRRTFFKSLIDLCIPKERVLRK